MDISSFRNGNPKRRIQGTGNKAALGVLVSLGLISWTAWENASLEITEYVHHDSQIPEPFSGFRIAHVTDLHNSVYGKQNVRLLEALRGTKPDCIFITGDLVDSRNTNLPIALDFVRRTADIAPIYYVPGNHESRLRGQYAQLVRGLKEYGVNVLANQTATLFRGKERICLIGADDPGFQIGDDGDLMKSSLSKLAISEESFNILLVHRPELFPVYSDFPIDLVFSGHSHGGQIRIPHLGGVYVPCQGFFPTYDAGKFTKTQRPCISAGDWPGFHFCPGFTTGRSCWWWSFAGNKITQPGTQFFLCAGLLAVNQNVLLYSSVPVSMR